VDPTRLELVTSAMRRQLHSLLEVFISCGESPVNSVNTPAVSTTPAAFEPLIPFFWSMPRVLR
jgi:hypothetical protein